MNKPKVSDVFFTTFFGQYIEMMAVLESSEVTSGVLPMVTQSYMVDADEEYYYLGSNPIEIESAVKRNAVRYIKIIEELTEEQQLLKDMPAPASEEEVQ